MPRLARTPVIALDYNNRHKAVGKELIVDYETGNIYIASPQDPSILFDVTAQIYEQLEHMEGNNITIVIEGKGEVNLVEFLLELRKSITDSVQAIDTGKEANYVAKEYILDNKSIEAINKTMQLKGFNEADPLTIPRKSKDGLHIEWIEVPQIPDELGPGPGDGIIPPSNPDDGETLEVFIIEPVNNKIYLRASRRQRSLYVDRNCKVVLPRTLDAFSEVNWYLVTKSDFDLKLAFGSNVLWEDLDKNQPIPGAHHIYEFKTWDKGETWLGSLKIYNRTFGGNDENSGINIDYLNENYYNKTQTHDKFFDKDQITDAYYNKDEIATFIQSNHNELKKEFTTHEQTTTVANEIKETIKENYYNKENVDSMVSWKDEKGNIVAGIQFVEIDDNNKNKE